MVIVNKARWKIVRYENSICWSIEKIAGALVRFRSFVRFQSNDDFRASCVNIVANYSSLILLFYAFRVDAIEGQFFVQFLFLMNVLLGFDFFWFELPTPSFIDEFLLRRMEVADVIFFALVVFCTINIVTQVYEICFVNGRITYAVSRILCLRVNLVSIGLGDFLLFLFQEKVCSRSMLIFRG